MQGQTNIYGDVSYEKAGQLAAFMLTNAAAQVFVGKLGDARSIGKNKGRTIHARRYHVLPPALAPLADAVTPAGLPVTFDDFEVSLEQYGSWVGVSDRTIDTHQDDVLNIEAGQCGDQISETLEQIDLGVLKGGTNVGYAGGPSITARTSVATDISLGDVRLAERTLLNDKAKYIRRIVTGTTKVGTEPIGPAFVALAHTDMKSDIRDISGFTPVEKYAKQDALSMYEVGKVENTRFVCMAQDGLKPWLASGASTTAYLSNGALASSNCDVYPVLFFGENAFVTVALAGRKRVTPKVRLPKPADGDELGQRGSVGWKLDHATMLTAQLWMYRLESACKASPS